MKIENAIKKLEKASGQEVNYKNTRYSAIIGKYEVSFIRNGSSGNATNFYVKRVGMEDDIMTDYWTGVFCDNMTQAIRMAKN